MRPATIAATASAAAAAQGCSLMNWPSTAAALFVPVRLGGVDLHTRFGLRGHEFRNVAQRGLLAGARELAVLVQHAHELAVDLRVARDAFLLLEEVGLAGEVADQAPRFGHEQR